MTGVSGLTVKASEQHIEMGAARRSKDYTDCKIFIDWLRQRNPFVYEDTNLHSLSLGLTSDENDGINCEIAEEIGKMIQAKLDNLSIVECTIKRKDQVKPIITLQSKVQLNKESVIVNPTMLFTRLVAIAQREKEDIEEFFAFELTQEPMSLFKHGLMRKPDKPSLRKAVMKDDEAVGKNQLQIDPYFVVDGGALLHRVRWIKNSTFDELSQVYVSYVRRHYKSCTIVFDGYDGPSTKSNEHMRRTGGGKRCPNIDVVGFNKVSFTQESFLNNKDNKTRFIRHISIKVQQDGQTVKICEGDADTTIVSTALKEAETNNKKAVVTVADDTDVAMMLLYHWQEHHGDVYFFQERLDKAWNMKVVCQKWNPIRQHILFVHSFSGCDTTSAPFGKGKNNLLSLVTKNKTLQIVSDTMGDVWADNRDVEEAAIKAFQIIYGGNDLTDLCKLRYRKYLDMCWKGKIDPEKMPPTESAAILHGFRVHLQIMNWKILEEEELKQIDPSKWGWKIENSQMMPIKTDKQVAPDSLLKIIKCNCKATSKSPCSTNLCSCRKHGLSCMQSCGECHGETCENKEVFDGDSNVEDDLEDEEENRNIFDIFDAF